jgi:hypothetical protein
VALASRNRNLRNTGRANERSERQQKGRPSAGRFLTKGSRHPDRRRRRSLRGGAGAQGLGNRETAAVLQDVRARFGEKLRASTVSRDDTGCPRFDLEGGDSGRRESPAGAFASGPRPMLRVGQSRHAPALPGLDHVWRASRDARLSVKTSFARATAERSVAGEDRREHGSSLGLS